MIDKVLSKLNAIPADKVLHFAVGSILFAVFLPFMPPKHALIGVILCGLAKELYDAFGKNGHPPDVWDATATVFGGATCYFCATH